MRKARNVESRTRRARISKGSVRTPSPKKDLAQHETERPPKQFATERDQHRRELQEVLAQKRRAEQITTTMRNELRYAEVQLQEHAHGGQTISAAGSIQQGLQEAAVESLEHQLRTYQGLSERRLLEYNAEVKEN